MRWGEPFVSQLFTEQELGTARNASGYRWKTLAGRFAAKEAVVKVFRGGDGKIAWTDIEVLTRPNGEPFVRLHGAMSRLAEQLGIAQLLLSVTHDANLAVAIVLGVGVKKETELHETSLEH